ncbi:coiled-coil domain-containing protein 127-like [Carassius carassius]|uniref:coiled-coil domain-containing protein 127-like n=1 Tax=Carassius carassius TaxID=217509 RepID=UPI002868F630|nr:coiled-coil domain-containing protein 127-like [Carassius carassius]
MAIPERQGGGDGDRSKWKYYAFLVPMLGLAAFGWIWSKQFQTEIQDDKGEINLQALAFQNLKLNEEHCYMRLEEKSELPRLFQKALDIEKGREQIALAVLNDVEYRLMERQRAFCSIFVHHTRRVEMEKDLLIYTAKEPLLAHLHMEDGLRDIFKNDRSCAEYLNTDKRRNGSLMWLYLRYWKLQLTLQTHQRAKAAMLGTDNK